MCAVDTSVASVEYSDTDVCADLYRNRFHVVYVLLCVCLCCGELVQQMKHIMNVFHLVCILELMGASWHTSSYVKAWLVCNASNNVQVELLMHDCMHAVQ